MDLIRLEVIYIYLQQTNILVNLNNQRDSTTKILFSVSIQEKLDKLAFMIF